MKRIAQAGIGLIAAGALIACQAPAGNDQGSGSPAASDQELDKITFALDWTPNTNHSGLFVARDQGYFAEEGLEVDLQQTDMTFIEMVGTGAAQFGIASQEQVLQARAASGQVPIVSVAAVLQHITSGFASFSETGISTPTDFEGRTYAGWGTELELAMIKTLMDADGADYDQVTIINQSATDFFAALETEADFVWIYYGWDGISAELRQIPLNFMLLQDVDPALDMYSPTIITNEQTIAENPELIERFLRAAARGYQAVMADPQLAVDALLAEAPELDPELVAASQAYLNEQYVADAQQWGQMSPQRWTDFTAWMSANELLESPITAEDAYTNDFLP